MPADGIGQGRPELLDPAQNRPPADVDAAIGEHAGDAFGSSSGLRGYLTQAALGSLTAP